jgi:hypothetical protein
MTVLTFLTGVSLFALGIYTKLYWFLTDWSAYLPVFYGLMYATCGEGMRSMPTRQRVFLAGAILLSFIVLATAYPLVIHVHEAAAGKLVEWESGRIMQPNHIYQATAAAAISGLYLVAALAAWFRKKPAAPVKHAVM